MDLTVVYSSPSLKQPAQEIAKLLGVDTKASVPDLGPFITLSNDNISYSNSKKDIRPGLNINFEKGSFGWRLARTEHEALLKKVIGKNNKSLKVLDATAGLLKDSIIMASLGHQVTACEVSKTLYAMTDYALKLLSKKDHTWLHNLHCLNQDVIDHKVSFDQYDLVYFDPMYPDSKKTTARSKELSMIREIIRMEDCDKSPTQIFDYLRLSNPTKLVVKRPIRVEAFPGNINHQITGKSIRYDVYI